MYEIFFVIFGISISMIVILSIMKKQMEVKKTIINKPNFIIEQYGQLNLSGLSTDNINILTSFLWPQGLSVEIINNSLMLEYDESDGHITGLIPNTSYNISISLYVDTKLDASISTPEYEQAEEEIFTSPLNITLGVATEKKNNKITKILATEKKNKLTKSPFTCNVNINVFIEKETIYPYIYINDATKALLSNKTNCYGRLKFTIKEN